MEDVPRHGPQIVPRWRAEIGEELTERPIRPVAGVVGGDPDISIRVDEWYAERIGSTATLD
jgi:hypothetical protein